MATAESDATAPFRASLFQRAGISRAQSSKQAITRLFALAGVALNGPNPWDIQVHHERFYRRVLAAGSLGLGEAYLDGDWHASALDQLFDRVISARLGDKLGLTAPLAFLILAARLQNRQSLSRVFDVAKVHYDLPMEIHEATYDRRLTASCAYWHDATTLEAAQERKLDLICRKIGLRPHHSVLDIGCGWGAFVGFAAEKYGVRCTGVTVSTEQVAYIKRRYGALPVEPLLLDYRLYAGDKVDRVVSAGMFEHVGAKNYRTYFECARKYLKSDGLFLLHTIWENERHPVIDAWQNKYIFPNGDLPSLGEITSAVEGLFVVEDVHNFGADYDRTLMAWNENFQVSRMELAKVLGERFCRMWEYYLLQNAAAFRCRHISVGQLVLSPQGIRGGYQAIR